MTNTTTTPQLIAASKLEKSPQNARRTVGKMGMDELKASLLSHGLMQNLVVTDPGDGTFRVIAGGRRLEAIRSLQAEGKLPEEFAVPCQIVSEDRALEMSLAENTVRLAMHPADQFAAFAALIDHGQSAAEVAERFGVEESIVLKRMKLARVAPQLVAEYRNEGITLESLMAFAVIDDHRRQLKVFKSLQEWQKDDPSVIRAALTEKMAEASGKLARFVGLDTYLAAGGSTIADLFADEIYLEKPAILHKLAQQKLDTIRKELQSEGWGWIEVNPERDWTMIHRCGRIQPVMHRLEESEQQLASLDYDEVHKKLAGCFVSIGHDGTPSIDKGLVKPEHRKALAKVLGGGKENGPDAPKPQNAIPETLRKELTGYRLQIAQVEIARHPELALDLLAFSAASRLLNEHPATDGPNIAFPRNRVVIADEATAAAKAFAAVLESLPSGWRKKASEAARFEAFRSLPQAARLKYVAYCVALTLQPKLGPHGSGKATAYDVTLALTNAAVTAYWRPAKGNFLSHVNRVNRALKQSQFRALEGAKEELPSGVGQA